MKYFLWYVLLLWLVACEASDTASATPGASPAPSVALASNTLTATPPTRAPTAGVTLTPTAGPTATPRPDKLEHLVAPNETVGGIAQRYGVTVEAILQANGIADPRLLRAGQTLVIPLPALTPTVTPTATFDPTQPTPTPAPPVTTYVVQGGDTLSGIAAKYNIAVDDIMASNGLTNTFLRVGQSLVVPPPTATPTITPLPPPTITPTPGLAFEAPTLLYPPDGATFSGDVSIVLNWTSVGALAENQYYVLRLRAADDETRTEIVWSKAPSHRLSPVWRGSKIGWDVIVVQQTQLNADGAREGKIQSPFSPTRQFTWK